MSNQPEEVLVIESPKAMIEGEAFPFTLTWQGASSVTAGTTIVYRDGTDVSATVLSGSDTANGIVQTTKTLTAQSGDGGKKYVMIVTGTVDGNTEKRKLIIHIVDPKSA